MSKEALVKDLNIEKDLVEHYKLMADFLKHLSVLSVTFILLGIGLSSRYFEGFSGPDIPLNISMICLFLASIFSVLGHLSYIDTFRVPDLLSGNNYHKLVRATAIPLILFIIGIVCLGIYLVLSLVSK